MSELKEAAERLSSWSTALKNEVAATMPQVFDALTNSRELPEGCTSRASLALTVFDQVNKKLREVNAAVLDVEKAISKHGA